MRMILPHVAQFWMDQIFRRDRGWRAFKEWGRVERRSDVHCRLCLRTKSGRSLSYARSYQLLALYAFDCEDAEVGILAADLLLNIAAAAVLRRP